MLLVFGWHLFMSRRRSSSVSPYSRPLAMGCEGRGLTPSPVQVIKRAFSYGYMVAINEPQGDARGRA